MNLWQMLYLKTIIHRLGIRKNVFSNDKYIFDGTKNNKSNSDARVNNHSSFEKYGKSDDESSYQNDWSNVARLWENCTNPNLLYIEGIGTTDLKGDSTMGYAFGSGWTGIRFKVRKGCEQAAAIIKKKWMPIRESVAGNYI
ncbi:hypothetical protein KUH03_01005 [Sphingobacterium sp. E70]|uniref:hypothetical protein n=1 Tax=Sphingobacterium sp. E70 TaxID=2853439 RepID=UPI00211C322A|nr:hypothetical protein [Sphingobacterium sp. E70]ULT25622.1 hypothetical protein KUH03_01005 [Sphingobacterium sp. E70]